eukprot:GHVS01079245.1.p1 GENE.GHVS01079245.1~~GHVS01079245.1.p1  ORF type:complete len:725 (+),score=74.38 GHVS01079245.1:117-2291(+)
MTSSSTVPANSPDSNNNLENQQTQQEDGQELNQTERPRVTICHDEQMEEHKQQEVHELVSGQQPPTRKPRPCDPVTLAFSDLTFDVRIIPEQRFGSVLSFPVSLYKCLVGRFREQTKKRLIDGVSGIARPGDLVALMGASGAGKSTLLKLLSRREIDNGGSVIYNDRPTDFEFTRRSCFIQQEDIFFGFITVREHLRFQAKLRTPRSAEVDLDEVVDRLMDLFGLQKIADSPIGNIQMGARRGISGGEKKRLSVSTELLTNPSVIFADEPTSGLDAFMAEAVVSTLQKLAAAGRTIISTIHQPSTEVFEKFSKLLLLAEGRVVYFGDRVGAIPWFIRLGHACPPYTNPADFLIEVLAIPSGGDERNKKLTQIDSWVEAWNTKGADFLSEWESSLKNKFEDVARPLVPSEDEQFESSYPQELSLRGKVDRPLVMLKNKVYEKKSYSASVLTQFNVLLSRALLNNRRNPMLFHARLAQTIFTALVGGFVFFQLGVDKVISKNGACFFLLLTQGLSGSMGVIQVFTCEAPVALREYYSGIYSILAYFWAKLLSDVPFQIFNPILFICISWFMIGLNNSVGRFAQAVLFVFLVTNATISLGYIISAGAPNIGVAVAINPVVVMPMTLVSGFMIILSTLPDFWIWLVYMSPFRWGWSGLMHATWEGVSLPACNKPPPSCFQSGNEVLEYYAIDKDTIWGNALALIIQILVFRLVAMLVMLIRCSRGKKV